MNSMIDQLAYSLGRNDEGANIALANELVKTKNKKGIKDIVEGLDNPKEQIANDCIKVLYETGGKSPELIADYVNVFIKLLSSKNNRLVWGAMTALSEIAELKPEEIFGKLDTVIRAYHTGSVITVDNSISVFAKVAKSGKKYEAKIFPVILKHLETCRPKEVGQHAERAFVCINEHNAEAFKQVLLKRRDSLTEPQQKRVDTLLKKIPSGTRTDKK